MSSPSARPPSSLHRAPDLDSREARAFVERAASHPSSNDPREGRGAQPAPALPGAAATQRQPLRPLTLRIPESLHSSLLFIAENGSRSMNQFVIDALAPAVEAQIEKINRRKELGLD
jgi:hypothetical protein